MVFPKRAPQILPHLSDMFRDYPWLWGVKSGWYSNTRVVVKEAGNPGFWDTVIAKNGEWGAVGYVFVEGSHYQELHTVTVEPKEGAITLFDLLEKFVSLHNLASEATYLAVNVEETETQVWTDRKGLRFAQTYFEENCARKA